MTPTKKQKATRKAQPKAIWVAFDPSLNSSLRALTPDEWKESFHGVGDIIFPTHSDRALQELVLKTWGISNASIILLRYYSKNNA